MEHCAGSSSGAVTIVVGVDSLFVAVGGKSFSLWNKFIFSDLSESASSRSFCTRCFMITSSSFSVPAPLLDLFFRKMARNDERLAGPSFFDGTPRKDRMPRRGGLGRRSVACMLTVERCCECFRHSLPHARGHAFTFRRLRLRLPKMSIVEKNGRAAPRAIQLFWSWFSSTKTSSVMRGANGKDM